MHYSSALLHQNTANTDQMLPFQAYGIFGQPLQEQPNLVNVMDDGSTSASSSRLIKKSSSTARPHAHDYDHDHSSSCKSHKEAERRRRHRINCHLSTLRSLLPSTTKTDKASLLAEVVHHVKELRKQAADVARQNCDACCTSNDTDDQHYHHGSSCPFPGESDEAVMNFVGDTSTTTTTTTGGAKRMVRVSVCCDDRPGLNRELAEVIRSARARAVRAEMMTVGGRTKSVVVMQWAGEEDVGILERGLKAVVENRASDSGVGHGNKRARI